MSATRVAIIADIHGNLPALEAVVHDIEAQVVDEVLVAGDLVGRGPCGGAVVDRVRQLGWPSIRGNHEDYLLNFRRGEVPAAWLEAGEWAASRWMAEELSPAHEDYIDSLPMTMASHHDRRLRLVHGSPRSYNQGLGPWSSDAELSAHLAEVEEDVLVCAHTHRPMIRQVEGGTIVNVGSVGLPFNGDWRAQYAIFTLGAEPGGGRRWSVELQQVEWDRQAMRDIYVESGFLSEGEVTAALLRREMETARPWLVPFLKWAEASGYVDPGEALIAEFEQVYQPEAPLGVFFDLLMSLRLEQSVERSP